mgnify:CR=1 FL=1
MTLPLSGSSINFLNLQLEYGGSFPISMDEYYGRGNVPASGQVSLADFYQSTTLVTNGLLFNLDARNSTSWPGSGTSWNDISGNIRNCSLVNGPTGGTNAIEFDGTNDYAQFANAAWIPQGTSAKSFECVARIDAWRTGQNANLVSKTSAGNQSFTFGFKESSGTVSLFLATQGTGGNFSETTDFYNLPDPAAYLGSYHYYAFTYDGNIAKMYIDGFLVWTSGSGKLFRTNTAPMRFMCFDMNNSSFNWNVDGAMRGVRMYNTTLSASDISRNYASWGLDLTTILTVTTDKTPSFHYGSSFNTTLTFNQNVLVNTSNISVTNGSPDFSGITGITSAIYTLGVTPNPSTSNVTLSFPTTASLNSTNNGNNAVTKVINYSSLSNRTSVIIWYDATNSSSYSGSGTTWYDVAAIGSAINGTLTDGPIFNNTSPQTFTFDGVNDFVLGGWPTPGTANDLSVGVWMKTTSPNNTGSTSVSDINVMVNCGGDRGLKLGMNLGKISFGTQYLQASSQTYNDGVWHYIVGTRLSDSGSPEFIGKEFLYIDGQLIANGNGGAGNLRNSEVTVGCLFGIPNRNFFNGSISQVQIWNTVLTANEVTQTWNAQRSFYGR